MLAACAGYTINTVALRSPCDIDFRCARYLGLAWPVDGGTVKEVKVDDENLEAVP